MEEGIDVHWRFCYQYELKSLSPLYRAVVTIASKAESSLEGYLVEEYFPTSYISVWAMSMPLK